MLLFVPYTHDADIGNVLVSDDLGLQLGWRDLESLWKRRNGQAGEPKEGSKEGRKDERETERDGLYFMSSFMRSVMYKLPLSLM